jgi:hypothetical protein
MGFVRNGLAQGVRFDGLTTGGSGGEGRTAGMRCFDRRLISFERRSKRPLSPASRG